MVIRKIMVMGFTAAFILTGLSPLVAQAGRQDRQKMREERKAYRQQLSTEDKEKIKNSVETAIDKLKNLTDEQKAKIKTGVSTAIDKLRNLTPQQKEKLTDAVKRTVEGIQGLSAEQKAQVKDAIISALP